MTDSARKQITDEIGSRLASISEVNGYFSTVGKLNRARTTPFQSYDLPAMNYWPQGDEFLEAGAGYQERSFTVFIEYHDKTRDEPFTDTAERMACDIEIALNRAIASPAVSDNESPALGGLVTSLRVSTFDAIIGEGQAPFMACILTLTVNYKRRLSDPFTIVT